MDSLQLLTLYLTLTPIFSVRKAKSNLHTTPKLTVVMPISCLLPCADPGIFVRTGGGGGGPRQSDKKALTTLLHLFFFLFFFPFLSPGGGGVRLFPGGGGGSIAYSL